METLIILFVFIIIIFLLFCLYMQFTIRKELKKEVEFLKEQLFRKNKKE